jgi:membrane protease YdiL (CAAX protease family)
MPSFGESGSSISGSSLKYGTFARKHPLVVFFVLAYLFSWSVFMPMVIFRARIEFSVLGTFGPCLAALATHYLQTGNFRAFRMLGSIRRSVAGACLGIALIVLGYVMLPAVATVSPSKLNWVILISPTVYNYSTVLGGPLGEEFGWRGYALPLLEDCFGPLPGCAILGVLWAGWHVPLFLIHGWTTSPFWTYVLIVVGLSFIIGCAANVARFAVIPAILMHAAFNTVGRFLNGLFKNSQPAVSIPFELVLAMGGLAVGFILILITGGRLAYPRRQDRHPRQ